MNTFQLEEDKEQFKLFECACMKKFNTEFLHGEVGVLKSRRNKVKKDLQLRWKP